MSTIVGLDVGGANLKFATSDSSCHRQRFALWRSPDDLSRVVSEGLQSFPDAKSLAVTMTGELADCFSDRGVGVSHIVDHVARAADEANLPVAFYGVDGRFHTAEAAVASPDVVAAANWHALASYVAQQIAGEGLLIDIGSTTSDIIPIAAGKVATTARSDHERLCEGTLVYVGCRRTPVCAIVSHLNYLGSRAAVMNEVFATIDDARLVTGDHQERADDRDSADGQPRTAECAANRLARMIGLDRREVDATRAIELARQVSAAATSLLDQAIAEVESRSNPWFRQAPVEHPPRPWILSGHGQDLVTVPSDQPVIDLAKRFGSRVSRCATAFAVAALSGVLQPAESASGEASS